MIDLLSLFTFRCRQIRRLETELFKAFLNFGGVHEKFPQESGAVVFDHRCYGELVYGEVTGYSPVLIFGVCVIEAIFAPYPVLLFEHSF